MHRLDGNGYGLRSAERYRVSMTMAFQTDDAGYAWLNRQLGMMTGDFDEKTGRAEWHVYVPAQLLMNRQTFAITGINDLRCGSSIARIGFFLCLLKRSV